MKHHNSSPGQNSKPVMVSGPATDSGKNEINFARSPDEMARRACLSHGNQGSREGHEVQHWLAAEAEFITERNRTRTHSFNK